MANFIRLYELEHIYKHIESGRQYPSVSKVISTFRKGFDADYHSKRMAYRDLVTMFPVIEKKYKKEDPAMFKELHKHIRNENLFKATVEGYRFKWKKKGTKAATKGTEYHEKKEREDIKRGYAINPFDGKPYKVYTNETIDFNNLKPGCYLEIALCSQHIDAQDEYKVAICGTADKLFLCPDPTYSFLYCDMYDYKTNDDILKKGYGPFLKPFNKIDDTKVNGYTFQQSLYMVMLMLYGIQPRISELIISPDYGKTKEGSLRLPLWLDLANQMIETFADLQK